MSDKWWPSWWKLIGCVNGYSNLSFKFGDFGETAVELGSFNEFAARLDGLGETAAELGSFNESTA